MSHRSLVAGFTFFGILSVVLAVALAAAIALKPIPAAQAAPQAQERLPLDPSAPDTWVWRNCTIFEIFVNEGRAHVECTTAEPAGVYYYAMESSASTQAYVNRVLAILNTAYALNKTIMVTYDTAASANPVGCLASDCRALKQIIIRP